ncbi:UDP-galactose/UDP-glucose transporter 5B [Nymphaea thermarum]|nr:UDP-galactose/UDP-glucose transporter 5B [Nymphaea thermarum]
MMQDGSRMRLRTRGLRTRSSAAPLAPTANELPPSLLSSPPSQPKTTSMATKAATATTGSPLSHPRGVIDAGPCCASETERTLLKWVISVGGIMVTLVIYGVLQERIMRVPYGKDREFFKYSLFIVFCNRITTSTAAAGAVLVNKKALDPVAPLYKYCAVSVSNILTTTCQYEALKYVSFPVQTLAKCAKMIPVMVWGTFIMQKRYNMQEYLLAVLVTFGCTLFILYPGGGDINPYSSGRESTVWGVTLMMGYLGFDGFTSTFQDKLFKGYNMEIYNQIFYTTLCSCILSLSGLIMQGHLLLAIDFVYRHRDCLLDVILLSTVATLSQFFISYTIRTFGALTFATIMTTRQLVSILLSCVWFGHPLNWEQMAGAGIVFGSLYSKSFLKSRPRKASQSTQAQDKSNYVVIEDVGQLDEDHRHKQASLGRKLQQLMQSESTEDG